MHRIRTGGARVAAILPILVGAVACDVPTGSPIIESRWVVPTDGEATIAVTEFLPPEVTVQASAFRIDATEATAEQDLGSLCALCGALDGLTAPKPAFEGEVTVSADLPDRIRSAELIAGTLDVRMANGLTFDPIRPGTVSATGSLTIVVTDLDGTERGATVVQGSGTPFPPGTTLNRSVVLSAGPVTGLRVTVTVNSPAGDPVEIRTSDRVTATAALRGGTATSATIDVDAEPFTGLASDLDVEEIEGVVVDRISAGSFVLDVGNPFGVAATVDLRITGPFDPVVKTIAIPATAESTARVDFSGDELRRFLGVAGVRLEASGVTGAASGVRVTPAMELKLGVDLDVTLRVGG